MATKTDLSTSNSKDTEATKETVLKVTLNVIPNCNYRAGVNYNCLGLGIYSGIYHTQKVTHTVNLSGYSVMIEAYKIGHPRDGSTTKATEGSTGSSVTNSINSISNARKKTVIDVILVDEKTGKESKGVR